MIKRVRHRLIAAWQELATALLAILERPFASTIYLALFATIVDGTGMPAGLMTIMSRDQEPTVFTTTDGRSFALIFPDIDNLPAPAYGEDKPFIGDMQRLLFATGFFEGDLNGILDEETRHALRRAAHELGMAPSGDPTPALYEALDFLARNRDLVKTIEEILADRGMITSTPDGLYDHETRTAIIDTERRYGLRADGFPDIRLWNTLMNSLLNRPDPKSALAAAES